MFGVLASIREWARPRQDRSLFDQWCRNFAITLPALALTHLFLHGPWYEGIGMVVYISFATALAQYRSPEVPTDSKEDLR